MKIKTSVALPAALMSISTAIVNVAHAQEQSAEPVILAEIVVTAQKREETLRDVPISIAVFTSDDIEKHDIQRLQDFALLTPSVGIDQGSRGDTGTVTIRGIGALGGSQDIYGYYVDGFEISGLAGGSMLSGSLNDAARIEVLRGPQGTTFGRNVVAGAISVTTLAPEYEYSGSVASEVSNHGGRELRGAFNMPIVDGKAAARLSAFHRHSDGDIENVGPSGGSNDFDRWGVRGALRLEPTDQLTVDAAFSYESYEQGLDNTVADGIVIGQIITLKQIIDAGLGLVPAGSLPAGSARYFPSQNDQVAQDAVEYYNNDTMLGTLRAQLDLGAFSLVSVSGYASSKQDLAGDLDESEYDVFTVGQHDKAEFYSTELRLQSNGDRWFDWIGGVYASRSSWKGTYDNSSGSQIELITYLPGAVTGLPFGVSLLPNDTYLIGNDFDRGSESYAVFADGTFDLTPRLNFAIGVRYNHDRIDESVANSFNLGTLPSGLLGSVALPDEGLSTSSDEVTWRSSLRYALNDLSNVYGTVSRGYRAGGVQLGNPGAPPDYAPETMTNYEVGVKTMLLNRRLSVNAAVFRMEWDDIQIATVDRTNNAAYTDNAGGATAQGVELETTYLPVNGWDITVGASYLDTEITEFIDSTGLDRSGTVLPNTPEVRVSASTGYTMPLTAQWDGFVRGTYIRNDKQLEGLVDGATTLQFIDSWDRVDVRLGARTDRVRIEAYCENLFDEMYATGIGLTGFSLSGATITSPSRRYGLRASVDF
jgi:iron complex outermembrane receptor protein